MRIKVLFVFTILAFLETGRAPGLPELRNPEAAHGGGRIAATLKRGVA